MDWKFKQLATYNAEVQRGIVHTKDWTEKMKVHQDKYNNMRLEHFKTKEIKFVDDS